MFFLGLISVNLAHGGRGMARRGVIVKRLASIEDFGSMDVLCSDKTGTLTQGLVRVESAVDHEGNPSGKARLYAFLNAQFDEGRVLSSLWGFAATSASGQPAMIGHRRDPETGRDDHSTLTILTFDGEGITAVAAFVEAPLTAAANGSAFRRHWSPGGPWA